MPEDVFAMVRRDLNRREEVGTETYGGPLLTHNGRDALWDAYEEALDLAMYLRQAIAERDEPRSHHPYDVAGHLPGDTSPAEAAARRVGAFLAAWDQGETIEVVRGSRGYERLQYADLVTLADHARAAAHPAEEEAPIGMRRATELLESLTPEQQQDVAETVNSAGGEPPELWWHPVHSVVMPVVTDGTDYGWYVLEEQTWLDSCPEGSVRLSRAAAHPAEGTALELRRLAKVRREHNEQSRPLTTDEWLWHDDLIRRADELDAATHQAEGEAGGMWIRPNTPTGQFASTEPRPSSGQREGGTRRTPAETAREAAAQYGVTVDGTETPRDLLVALLVEQGHDHPRDVVDALDVLGFDVYAAAPGQGREQELADGLGVQGIREVIDALLNDGGPLAGLDRETLGDRLAQSLRSALARAAAHPAEGVPGDDILDLIEEFEDSDIERIEWRDRRRYVRVLRALAEDTDTPWRGDNG